MVEFIQANISWVVLGAFFILMMRMHGSGSAGGCCGGHQHGREREKEAGQQPRSLEEAPADEKERELVTSGNHKRSGECH